MMMTFLQLMRMVYIREAIVKLLGELDPEEWRQSWLATARDMMDNEINLELMDIENDIRIAATPTTTEAPAEAEATV